MPKGLKFSKFHVVAGDVQELEGSNLPRERNITRYTHGWVRINIAQRSEQWLSDATFELSPTLLHHFELI